MEKASSEKKSQIKLNPRNYLSKLLIEAKLRIFTAKKGKVYQMLSKQRKQKNPAKRAFQRFRKSNLYDFPAVGKDSIKTLLKLS